MVGGRQPGRKGEGGGEGRGEGNGHPGEQAKRQQQPSLRVHGDDEGGGGGVPADRGYNDDNFHCGGRGRSGIPWLCVVGVALTAPPSNLKNLMLLLFAGMEPLLPLLRIAPPPPPLLLHRIRHQRRHRRPAPSAAVGGRRSMALPPMSKVRHGTTSTFVPQPCIHRRWTG